MTISSGDRGAKGDHMRPDGSLRLAFIAPGNSIHTRRWLEYFADRGHVVGLVSYGRLTERVDGIELLGELTELADTDTRAGLTAFLSAARRTRRVVRSFSPDLLHAHFVTGPGWLGAATGVRPLVISAWGSDVLVDTRRPQVRALHRLALRRAACVLYDADVLAAKLSELGTPRARTRRALWGVDVDLFAPGGVTSLQRTALGLPASEAVVLAIRGLRDLQNPLAVVRAFAEVRRTHPDVILALKLGPSDAGLTAAVAAEIESLDLGASVSVIGQMPHEKLAELYRAADVCLSVPSSDGTSVALLEAMASGRPMVVSDLPANREWITDGVNGSVVPPNDPAALADAIKRLLDSSELRSTFGHAARARVESAASSHEQMHEVELLYRSLVSNES